jgi:hypothetical protein
VGDLVYGLTVDIRPPYQDRIVVLSLSEDDGWPTRGWLGILVGHDERLRRASTDVKARVNDRPGSAWSHYSRLKRWSAGRHFARLALFAIG